MSALNDLVDRPPQRIYYAVFAALIGLTLLTVWLSLLDLGPWHGVVGLAIATCKASLVVLFFMHVLYSGRLVWIMFGAGLVLAGHLDLADHERLSDPGVAGVLRGDWGLGMGDGEHEYRAAKSRWLSAVSER